MFAEWSISRSPADESGADQPRIDPAFLFRPGKFDAWAVLIVFYVRKLFIPMLWIGMTIAIVADPDHIASVSLETPEDTWDALLSPLAGIVIAIALRVGATFAALLLAIPASAAFGAQVETRRNLGRRLGALGDRWNVASAFRSLRWTYDARQYATERIGGHRRAVSALDRFFVIANVVLPIVMILASAVASG